MGKDDGCAMALGSVVDFGRELLHEGINLAICGYDTFLAKEILYALAGVRSLFRSYEESHCGTYDCASEEG